MITAQTCDMPIALICLVDEKRVWFKSQQGIDGVTEIPRNIGFCSHTITQSDLLEIKDATVDDRFYNNPMVTESNFQYYAGVPLTTIDGLALGTLCVMDRQPRALSEENKEFLRRMAYTVVALIEARINSNKNSSDINHLSNSNAIKQNLSDQQQKTDYNNINNAKVFIIDEDRLVSTSLTKLFSNNSLAVEIYSSPEQFLDSYSNQHGCLICESKFYNINDFTLQEQCKQQSINIPVIFITAHGDIPTSVAAMRAGAIDFLEKPLNEELLLAHVFDAIKLDAKNREHQQQHDTIYSRLSTLTAREKQVMKLLVSNRARLSNKDIAEILDISRRTVEVHRSTVMAKMLASSRLELLDITEICQISTDKENTN